MERQETADRLGRSIVQCSNCKRLYVETERSSDWIKILFLGPVAAAATNFLVSVALAAILPIDMLKSSGVEVVPYICAALAYWFVVRPFQVRLEAYEAHCPPRRA